VVVAQESHRHFRPFFGVEGPAQAALLLLRRARRRTRRR
jgi:hypothetical protein